MRSLDPKSLLASKLHGYLLSAIALRPIAFASTLDADGNPNLSPFSFFNVFSANPPILIFSPARRVKNNTTKHTLQNAEIPKPIVTLGVGVDAYPEHVKNSMILTGNDLGMLGNIDVLPSKENINTFIEDLGDRYTNIKSASLNKKHKLAHNYLSFGDLESASKIVLS